VSFDIPQFLQLLSAFTLPRGGGYPTTSSLLAAEQIWWNGEWTEMIEWQKIDELSVLNI